MELALLLVTDWLHYIICCRFTATCKNVVVVVFFEVDNFICILWYSLSQRGYAVLLTQSERFLRCCMLLILRLSR